QGLPRLSYTNRYSAVLLDFYGTLARATQWTSVEIVLAEHGYELSADVRERWWNDGLDGIEHDEHSQSRDHYVAWQQSRMQGMLDECGIARSTQDAVIARARETGG